MGAPLVEVSLHLAGLSATLGLIEKLPSPGASSPRERTAAVRIADGGRLIDAVYNWHVVRGACLPRALLQYALHRMDGVPAELRVGVVHPGDAADLAAHAWVDEPGAEPSSENAPFSPVLVRRSVAE
jgi:hypothetical protein